MTSYNIIKVNATKSTNDKVKMLIKSKKINNKDVISAKYQYKGKGQLAKSGSLVMEITFYAPYILNLLKILNCLYIH